MILRYAEWWIISRRAISPRVGMFGVQRPKRGAAKGTPIIRDPYVPTVNNARLRFTTHEMQIEGTGFEIQHAKRAT